MNSQFYNSSQSRWSPGDPWWLCGVALTGLIDYMRKTGSAEYMSQAEQIIQVQREPLAWWPQGDGEFRGDSTDDTGWWALAMVRMFDLTGDTAYLNISIADEAYMYDYWTGTDCGGGIYVDIRTEAYKNAIANELYIKLAASLHNRVPGDTQYLAKAESAWSWFQASGMINTNNLVNDGLTENDDGSCYNNKLPTWTYNQGVILGALTGKHPLSISPPPHTSNTVIQNCTAPPKTKPTSPPPKPSPRPCSPAPPSRATAFSPSAASPRPAATATRRSSRASSPPTWPSWMPPWPRPATAAAAAAAAAGHTGTISSKTPRAPTGMTAAAAEKGPEGICTMSAGRARLGTRPSRRRRVRLGCWWR